MKKIARKLFLLVLTAGFSKLVVGAQKMPDFTAISNNQQTQAVSIATSDNFNLNNKSNYVSITHLGNKKFAIANYTNIFIFDRNDATICMVSIIDESGEKKHAITTDDGFPFNASSEVNPTGVFFSESGKLYVANYKINNILSGTIDVENCNFKIEAEYASTNSLGPENVWADRESNLLFSANYDAGTITAFDIDTRKEVWAAIVPQAHGVSVNGGYVYATGLTERMIYKINIADGSIVKKRGGLGWDPMKSEFMWPTSIYPVSEQKLVVSDAQSGFVSMIDSNSLETIQYTGGNGPSQMLFNYPYAAILFEDEIAVMQSQRKEIVFISENDFHIVEQFSFYENGNQWPLQSSLPVFGVNWKGYQDFSGENIRILGKFWRLGFGGLHSVDGEAVIKIPDIGTLFNDGSYIYFMQGYTQGRNNILLSSSSKTALGLIEAKNGVEILIPRVLGDDFWIFSDRVVSGDGTNIAIDHIFDDFVDIADRYNEVMLAQGWLDKNSLYEIFEFQSLEYDYQRFLTRLDNVFNSPEGRKFQRVYDKCSYAEICDTWELQEAAKRYYFETSRLPYKKLDEYLLVGMLTGVVSNKNLDQAIEYNNCDKGNYYPGFGLDALSSDTLDDYLSAVDLERSVVCFTLSNKLSISGLDITWNDLETASESIEIYGRKIEKKDQWELIGSFSDYPISMLNGYAKSSLRFMPQKNYDEFYLATTDGGIQRRLLAREIKPLIVPEGVMDCNDSDFIGSHDIAALKTPSLQDYLSASDLASSSVCFSNIKQLNIVGGRIGWYSENDVATEIEVLASHRDDFTDSVSIGRFLVDQSYETGGYYFSDIHFNARGNYPFYKVKLLSGTGQNRFILRHLSLLTEVPISSSNTFLELAHNVSASMHYEASASHAAADIAKNLHALTTFILSQPMANSRDYSLVFVSKLPDLTKWTVYDLENNGNNHTIVEIESPDGSKRVYDPTIGIEYLCSLESMLDGSCTYDLSLSYAQVHPAFDAYKGAGFFYSAKMLRKYDSVVEIIAQY